MATGANKEEYNLKEAWEKACESFAKTTKTDLGKSPKYSPDEVLEQIRAKQDQDESKHAKYRAAKDVLSKTLDTINTLGNIASQGASMVFGPSTLCFNAVSYLIQAGKNFRNIFTSLTELFSRILDVLERFKIYLRMGDDIDIALRKIVNDLLICFVSICELSIEVLHGNKAILALKVFAFNSDEGVSAKLKELNNLVQREDQMRGALILESGKTNEKKIDAVYTETKEGYRAISSTLGKMVELEMKCEADAVQAKQLETIKAALGKPSHSYETTYKGFISRKVKNTGEWLHEDPLYTEWVTRKQSSFSALCLSGGEGYGKSFLMSIAIQDLKKRCSQGKDDLNRTSIAYYYFQRDVKGSQTVDKDSPSLDKALMALAWQIANSDAVYRKELAASCRSVEDLQQINDLWEALFANSSKSNATFYFVLDGIDQMEEEHVTDLALLLNQIQKRSDGLGALCLRILLSGRDAAIERIKSNLDSDVPTISIAAKNKDDIEKFVHDRIASIGILSSTSKQVTTLREDIFTSLAVDAQRDFINVDLLLKEIGNQQRPVDMRAVLERSRNGETRSDTIAREIERLNKTLDNKDIIDLNELLTWVIFAYRTLTLNELEAVLFMRNGDGGSSLQPLSDQIKEKYSKIFDIVEYHDPKTKEILPSSTVSLVSDSIQDYFKKTAEAEEAQHAQSWTETGDVNESEVRIVKRFLESICEPALFTKFGFEEFFHRKLNTTTATIAVDLDSAHLKIVTECIQVISGEGEELYPLLEYAGWYFPAHLTEIDLSLAHPQRKTAVGRQLLRMFADERVIQRWWTDENLFMRYNWLYNDGFAEVVLNWFKDSAVVKGLAEEGKEWVKNLTSNSTPDADLLENITKFLAKKWLQDSGSDLMPLFSWVHGFLTKIGNRKDNEHVKRSTEDAEADQIAVSDILAAADWAAKHMAVEKFDYEETRNLARTLREYGKYDEAIEKFKLASSLESDNWFAQWGLAVTYRDQEKWALAIETLEAVVESIKNGEAKAGGPTTELPEMLNNLAWWNKEAGNDDKAIEIYEEMMKEDPDDYNSTFEFLALLRKKEDYAKMLKLLQSMKLSVDEKTGLDRWTKFYHEYAHSPDYHETIFAAASRGKSFDVVKDGYQKAVDTAKAKMKDATDRIDPMEAETMKGILGMLLYYFALFVFYHDANESGKTLAVTLWEQTNELEEGGSEFYSYLPWAKRLVIKRLSPTYLDQARTAGPDSEIAAYYISKLQRLAKDDDSGDIWMSNVSPKHSLARYYGIIGQPELAKDALRANIKTSLDLLSDDDPYNDWQAYKGLAIQLMSAGQDDDALAAWSMIRPYEEQPQENASEGEREADAKVDGEAPDTAAQDEAKPVESPTIPDGPLAVDQDSLQKQDVTYTNSTNAVESNPDTTSDRTNPDASSPQPAREFIGPLSYSCDGRCGTIWSYANDIWVCRDCLDVQFDEKCLKLMREDKLPFRICNKNHEFLHVPKYDEEAVNAIGKGNVKVGSTIMKTDDWVKQLRMDWGLVAPEYATSKENTNGVAGDAEHNKEI